MALDPADEVAAPTDAMTSATPRPVSHIPVRPPEPAGTSRSGDEPEGGVTALRVPRKALFTKQFDTRASELLKRRPQNYTDLDWIPNDDE